MSRAEKFGWVLLVLMISALICIRLSLPEKKVIPELTEYNEGLFQKSEEKLLLNKATVQNLEDIPGIGEKTAQAIVLYRLENGYFHSYEELLLVKGIGEEKMNKIKEYYQEKGY